jgi:hypothetical protein
LLESNFEQGLPVTKCYQTALEFSSVKGCRVEAVFSGGDITSNEGVILLSEADNRLGLYLNVARDKPLSSAASLSRFESRVDREAALAIHQSCCDESAGWRMGAILIKPACRHHGFGATSG